MKFFILISIFSFSAHAQFVGIKDYDKRYVVKQIDGKFTYQTQDHDKSILVKKCNKVVFKNFWKDFKHKFKHKKLAHTQTNEYVRLNYKKQIYKIAPTSEFGVYLKSIESSMQSVFMESKVHCEGDPGEDI
jgi:hypothetical protein